MEEMPGFYSGKPGQAMLDELTPSPIFPFPRTMGILLFCSLIGVFVFSGDTGVHPRYWTTWVGLLFNWVFVSCWAIVAVALTIWHRRLLKLSMITIGTFVIGVAWNTFTSAGTIGSSEATEPLTLSLTGLLLALALLVGVGQHIVNVHDGQFE